MYMVRDIAEYVIWYSEKQDLGISNLKLQKILYFIQAYFLICSGKPCFCEKIEAWDFGPVVPGIYRRYKQYGGTDIPRIPEKEPCLAQSDKERINKVVDKFADYSAADLTEITQKQLPWMEAVYESKNNEISTASMKQYFADKEPEENNEKNKTKTKGKMPKTNIVLASVTQLVE